MLVGFIYNNYFQNNIVSAQPGKKASSICTNAHGTARNTVPNVPCLSK